MRKLKWSLQKDRLAKILRDHTWTGTGAAAAAGRVSGLAGFGEWLDTKGKGVVQDGERVRLAVCPGIRSIIGFYEELGRDM
jgi:hypothetical protein